MAIALQRGRLRARLTPRLVLLAAAFCFITGAYGAGVLLVPDPPPLVLDGRILVAGVYAAVVALVPYGQRALLVWCGAGALALGYESARWPPVPWGTPVAGDWAAWVAGQPAAVLVMLGVVVLGLTWVSIVRIQAARVARPRRSAGLFHPIPPVRRAAAGVAALGVFLMALQAAAVVRMTALQVAGAPVEAAQLRMAYLPHLLVAAFLVAGSATGGNRPLFHLVVAAAVARGLWPYPLPGEPELPGLLPAAFWTVLVVHVPVAVAGTYLVQRLLRWPYPRTDRT
ncbi:hypothetical protein [Nonomuraea typhae]|uniref:hypothetical protein n=1 Tax=Nonomuraea typhae TaxID=2603600 RepID=UPI0012F80B48|nr:hypothetical protein [Nonomuraea typhae]